MEKSPQDDPQEREAAMTSLLGSMAWTDAFLDAPPAGPDARGGVFGETPLHLCAIRGDLAGARLLLDAGVAVDPRGEHGFTPLHEAILQGHAQLAALLLARGADPGLRNDWGDEAADLAATLVEAGGEPGLLDLLRAARAAR